MGERENLDRDPADLRRDIDETRSSIGAKLELLEESVKDTARDTYADVKGKVEETYADVKEKVEDVKKNFSLSHQVQERPWAFFGGSIGVGFIVGSLLSHKLFDHDFEPVPVASFTTPPRMALKSNGSNGHTNGSHGHNNGPSQSEKPEEPGFFSNPAVMAGLTGLLSTTFGPELRKAKQVAIGSVLGLVREIARDAVPASLADKTASLIDNVTRQLGGTPVSNSQPKAQQPQLATVGSIH